MEGKHLREGILAVDSWLYHDFMHNITRTETKKYLEGRGVILSEDQIYTRQVQLIKQTREEQEFYRKLKGEGNNNG